MMVVILSYKHNNTRPISIAHFFTTFLAWSALHLLIVQWNKIKYFQVKLDNESKMMTMLCLWLGLSSGLSSQISQTLKEKKDFGQTKYL